MVKKTHKLFTDAKNLAARFFADEEGATAAEYGLIAALIAVAIIGAVTVLGKQIKTTFMNISSNLPSGNQ